MKKVILLVLCLIFVLSGCGKLEKAEPFYTETKENVVFLTQYEYYFDDEHSIRCSWENKTDEGFSFYDTFELHVLGDDGEWYVVSKGEEVEFKTDYCYGISANATSNARYDLSIYIEDLKEGESSVGTKVGTTHLKATKVGATVSVEATLVKQEGRMYDFVIKAYEDGVLIGEGEHTRAVINVERFLAKLNK